MKEPYFICPLPGSEDINIRVDSMGDGHFNARRSNGARRHKGIDIAGEVGDTVVAAKSGITKVGEAPKSAGKYVVIFHFGGYETHYCHLRSINIKGKRWVWQGQNIGEVGKTGNARGYGIMPHLHFGIKKDKIAKDPLPYLKKEMK